MSLMKSLVWTIGIFGMVIFAVACGDDDDDEGHAAPAVASVAASAVGSAVDNTPASTTSAQRAAGGAGTAGTATQAAPPQLASASNEAGIWVNTGVGSVEAVGVGEEGQQIGIYQIGNQCREPVIVAEYLPNLIHGNHVVLVQHGHYLQFQKGQKGVTHVQVALTVG